MLDSKSELKDRVEARRKDLESRLAGLKANTREASREAIEGIQNKLASLKDILRDGWENLSESAASKLNEWLK